MRFLLRKNLLKLIVLPALVSPVLCSADIAYSSEESAAVHRELKSGNSQKVNLPNTTAQYENQSKIHIEKQSKLLAKKLFDEITKDDKVNTDNNKARLENSIRERIKTSINSINGYNRDIAEYGEIGYLYLKRAFEYIDIYNQLQSAHTFDINILEKLDEKNLLQQAVADFSMLIKLNPQDADIYWFRGCAYNDSELYKNAIEDFNKAISINPYNGKYYNDRAKSEAALGLYSTALTDFGKAIELVDDLLNKIIIYKSRAEVYEKISDETNSFKDEVYSLQLLHMALAKEKEIKALPAKDYYNLAAQYQSEKKYARAIMAYTKAIELEPQNTFYYSRRAETYVDMGRFDDAIKDCDKLISLEPDNLNHYETKAYYYSKSGQHEKSLATYAEMIAKDPENIRGYLNRAEEYTILKDYENALKDQDKMIELEKDDPDWYVNRINSKFFLGLYKEALEDIDKAIMLEPDDDFHYGIRSILNLALKRGEEALKDANKAISINPGESFNYTARGNAFYFLHDYDKAIEDYTKAISLKPDDFFSYYYRGSVYYSQNKYNKALEDYEKALKLDPKEISTYYSIADIYITLGSIDAALKHIDTMMKIDPANPFSYMNKGRISAIQGNHEDAIKNYTTAIELSDKRIKEDRSRYGTVQARSYYLLGLEKLFLYKDREAIECFNKAIELNGLNGEILDALNVVRDDLLKSEERIDSLNKAIAFLQSNSSDPKNKSKLDEIKAQIAQLEELKKQIQDDFYKNAPRPKMIDHSLKFRLVNYQEQDVNKAPADLTPTPIRIKPPSI